MGGQSMSYKPTFVCSVISDLVIDNFLCPAIEIFFMRQRNDKLQQKRNELLAINTTKCHCMCRIL